MTTPIPPRTGRRAGHAKVDEATADRRYYDFRTQLRVVDTGDWIDRLETTGRAWLAEKHVGLPSGLPATLRSDSAEARIDRLTSGAVETFRLTLSETGTQGTWLTEVLAVGRSATGGRISVTVRNSENRFVNRPRIVPRLLEDIEVLDGDSELVDDTWIVTVPHLREFLTVLSDPSRNAPVFVTAARPGADLQRVQDWMVERSRELAGLAHSYVLDAESNAALMRGLGQAMGIKPGSIRSFAPGPLAHDPEDALRHRRIGAFRLESLHPRAAAALVGRIARFEAASRPEATELRDARRAFDRKALDDRFRRRTTFGRSEVEQSRETAPISPPVWTPIAPTPAAVPLPGAATSGPASPEPSPTSPVRPAEPAAVEPPAVEPSSIPEPDSPLTPVEAPVTPAEPPTVADTPIAPPGEEVTREEDVAPRVPAGPPVTELAPAERGLLERFVSVTGTSGLAEAIEVFQVMNQLYEEAGERAREDLQERERLADEAAEHELSAKSLELELSGELSRRRVAEQNLRLLQVYQRPDADRTEHEPHPTELPVPELFSDVPAAVRALEKYVDFTGDPRATAELDEYDHAGLGVKRCWEGIIALHDYARATVESAHRGSFHDYLRAPPDGYSPFPLSHYAATESESTIGMKEAVRERTLMVPKTVDPSGYVEMWAHLKLLKVGRISPRLHFYDDASGTGKVYVGYIGRHLAISGS